MISNIKMLIYLQLLAVIIAFVIALVLVSKMRGPPTSTGEITGIIYSTEMPIAVINGQNVFEGDIVYGVKLR